jgi:hypothetical protein
MLAAELPIIQALDTNSKNEITSNILMFGGSEIASWAPDNTTCYSATERGLVHVRFPSGSVEAGLVPWIGLKVQITRNYGPGTDETTLAFSTPVDPIPPITGNVFDQPLEQLMVAVVARAGR